jgi:hypothetical protein
MKLASYDQLGISLARILGLAVAVSLAGALGAAVAVGGALGGGTLPILLIVGALLLYIVLSAPRRILDSRRLAQSREAVLLSAASLACLSVTRSNSRTALMLRSREPSLSLALKEVGRQVLLGVTVESAVSGAVKNIQSYSAVTALQDVAALSSRTFEAGDEESRGLTASSDLSRETKLPILMTACFFAPIMMLLYAVFSHSYAPVSLAELVAFEFILLDFAFYLSSGRGGHGES